MAEVFLCYLRLSPPSRWADFHFVGFLDDSENLKGRRLGGFPILGGLGHLRALSARMGINCVVITANLDPAHHAKLLAEADRLDLEVHQWLPEVEPQLLRTARHPGRQQGVQPAANNAPPEGLVPLLAKDLQSGSASRGIPAS
jgi:FlaA1/EpsC-like NDP-sugar epimerase